MQTPSTSSNQAAQVQWSRPKLITQVLSVSEAKALPPGVAVGDQHGGCSFNDNIAAVLESRSVRGWEDVGIGPECWTVILLDR